LGGPSQSLKNYSKDWDDELGVWKDRPRHDAASHGVWFQARNGDPSGVAPLTCYRRTPTLNPLQIIKSAIEAVYFHPTLMALIAARRSVASARKGTAPPCKENRLEADLCSTRPPSGQSRPNFDGCRNFEKKEHENAKLARNFNCSATSM
jgi:hypothetical protein